MTGTHSSKMMIQEHNLAVTAPALETGGMNASGMLTAR